jgi:hypothetical protein
MLDEVLATRYVTPLREGGSPRRLVLSPQLDDGG